MRSTGLQELDLRSMLDAEEKPDSRYWLNYDSTSSRRDAPASASGAQRAEETRVRSARVTWLACRFAATGFCLCRASGL
jgi:hypothetical protein